jgi:hypothetical protein
MFISQSDSDTAENTFPQTRLKNIAIRNGHYSSDLLRQGYTPLLTGLMRSAPELQVSLTLVKLTLAWWDLYEIFISRLPLTQVVRTTGARG